MRGNGQGKRALSLLRFSNPGDSEEGFDLASSLRKAASSVDNSRSEFNVRAENFKTIEKVGSGSTSIVYKSLYLPTGRQMAQKVIFINSRTLMTEIVKEIGTLKSFSHPNVEKYYGYYVLGQTVAIILEFMNLGNLNVLKATVLNERAVSYVARQILLGLKYLHLQKRIVHRDIKPHNILVNTQGEIKLGDFGICAILKENEETCKTSLVGSMKYMSPERLQKEPYGFVSDVWSLGLTLFELAFKRYPFSVESSCSPIELIETVVGQDISGILKQCSPLFGGFLEKCLQKDPALRSGVVQLLSDPFIKEYSSFGANDFREVILSQVEGAFNL